MTKTFFRIKRMMNRILTERLCKLDVRVPLVHVSTVSEGVPRVGEAGVVGLVVLRR